MLDMGKTLQIVKKAISFSKSDMCEAVLEHQRLSLTRFAESRISDNIDTTETILYIRSFKDKKIGVTATGDLAEPGIRRAVEDSEKIMSYMAPDENFVSLPAPGEQTPEGMYMVPGTEHFGPKERAEIVEKIGMVGMKGNLKASGAFRIEYNALAVANSLGLERFFMGNNSQLSLTMSGDRGNSGWAMEFNKDASNIDFHSLSKKATEKAVQSINPVSIEGGQYTVILEPAAVGQLLLLLSFMGFGCKTFYQNRSFMAGKLGEKIAGENFSVMEDADDPDFNYCPFDYEGVIRKSVPLIDKGIATGVVYNSYYANLMNAASTGHALPPTNNYGPYPKTLSVAPGDSRIEEMIKSTAKGVLITHFWYLNFLNPMRTMVTGTTLDGTFLIEDGLISHPIKNMRTNQSILEAFSNIEMISFDRVIYPQYSVLMKVPAMKINNFNLAAEEEDDDKC